MTKKLLLLLLLILLVLSVPQLRSFAAPVIDPVGEKLAQLAEPLVVKIRNPFLAWKAKDEARAIVILLRDQEAMGRRLPASRDFADWLRIRFRVNPEGLDPWGMPYYIKYTNEGAIVGSAGPDLEPNTADDIREILPARLR